MMQALSQHIAHNRGSSSLCAKAVDTAAVHSGNKVNTVEDIFSCERMIEKCNNDCKDLFAVVGARL